jgi:CRP-like cAMP-binding protein
MNIESKTFPANTVLCREGDPQSDLYFVEEGELIILMRKGTLVTAVAVIGSGEFMGEVAFFAQLPRGADVITTKPTKIFHIAQQSLLQSFPEWMQFLGQELAKKIRLLDGVIRARGLRRKVSQTVPILSIEQQRYYYQLIMQS